MTLDHHYQLLPKDKFMSLTAEQLIERRAFLGASEAAAALGMSSWFTQLQLYQSKKGLGEPIETTIPMMVGIALEPVTLELCERETGLVIGERQKLLVDPTCPWRRCSVDGIAEDGEPVEAKTSGDFRGWGEGEDEIPLPYLYNAHHTFACMPTATKMYFPVLIGGRTFKQYVIERSEDLVQLVRQGEEEFMAMVRASTPPPAKTLDDLKILYPRDNGKAIEADAAIEVVVSTLAAVKAEGKEIKEREEALVFDIKKYMGAHADLTLRRTHLKSPGGLVLATFNTSDVSKFDKDRLKKEHPSMIEDYTSKEPQRRLLLKVKS
jgi:putative phage-type endonuclease